MIWEPSDIVAAVFDSPDRIYNSGAQVMAVSGPAVGELRFENDYCAHTPFKLKANRPMKVSMLMIGGEGKSVVSAIKHYTELKGLPAVPRFEEGFEAAACALQPHVPRDDIDDVSRALDIGDHGLGYEPSQSLLAPHAPRRGVYSLCRRSPPSERMRLKS